MKINVECGCCSYEARNELEIEYKGRGEFLLTIKGCTGVVKTIITIKEVKLILAYMQGEDE